MMGTVQTLEVDVGHARYPITIGPGALGQAASLVGALLGPDVLIVSNTTVAPLYAATVTAGLGKKRVATCILPDGEQYKTLETAGRVFDALVDHRLNRDVTIVALGGGVIGDLAGFAAACYQRGVGCVQIPTTLLAQVDSSVGGKTGVNHPGGKNLIGAFHQPIAVIADTETLATLPDRELRAGLAEVIKYGCVADAELFAWLEDNIERVLARETAALIHVISRSCAIKAEIVAADEREHNLRAILNFGHTFGHAIEAATAYATYLHGEAVALGMLIAADLSRRTGRLDAPAERRIAALLTRAGLPTRGPPVGAARAMQLMRMDKKVLAGSVRLVLLAGLGRAEITSDYAASMLEAVLTEHFG
jgi:3-dehydroquinate synthase